MAGKGKTKGTTRDSTACRIAREMTALLTMNRRREEDERRKRKIMTRISSTVRNRRRKAAKLISNHNKGQPPAKYVRQSGIVCRVGKRAARVAGRRRWPSTMVATDSARPEEACDGILLYDVMAADILPRLPVKSLARFRCVCKRWRSLTYDPRFAMEQLIRGADPDHASIRFCINTCVPINQKTPMFDLNGQDGIDNGIDGDRKVIEDASFDFKFRRGSPYMISNTVNGLVCALCRDGPTYGVCYPYLFNPTTREVQTLPEISGSFGGCIGTLSLGFDSSSMQYKAVGCSNCTSGTGATLHVLTVGSREWRCLPKINLLVFSHMVVFLDGALHWLAFDNETRSTTILAFDIKDERFRFIPIPDTIVSQSSSGGHHLALWKLKDHLWLVKSPVATRRGRGTDLGTWLRMWKMEEGANHEWRRVYDIDVNGCVDDGLEGYMVRVIDEVGGKMLIQLGTRVCAYDIEGSKTLSLITGCLPRPCLGPFDVYMRVTPSIVSPSRLHALV